MHGVWVRHGPEGVYTARLQDAVYAQRACLQDDGRGPFAAERMQNQMDSIRKGNEQLVKQQKEKGIVDITKPVDMKSILALVSQDKPSEQNAASGLAAPHETEAAPTELDTDTDDEEPAVNHLISLLGVAPTKSNVNVATNQSKSQSAVDNAGTRVPPPALPLAARRGVAELTVQAAPARPLADAPPDVAPWMAAVVASLTLQR